MPQQYPEVDAILEAHGLSQSAIISILQDVQKHYRYLPQDVLVYVAKRLGISEAKVYSVATFYDNFSLEPKGKYVIKVCDGTACHVRKSPLILNALNRALGLNSEKHTTDDMVFTVETVSCLGTCGLAPVVMINDDVYGRLSVDDVEKVLAKYAD